jgi:hypothetical protein
MLLAERPSTKNPAGCRVFPFVEALICAPIFSQACASVLTGSMIFQGVRVLGRQSRTSPGRPRKSGISGNLRQWQWGRWSWRVPWRFI